MQDEIPAAPIEYGEDTGGAPAPSIDLLAIITAVLRRWKLITAITLSAAMATYGVLKLVPSLYTSTVEILVFDPQQEIDTAVQKPISPFIDAVGNDAMNTEINILQSKSVALRVARELGLDRDPEFQPHDRLAELAEWLGFPRLFRADNNSGQTIGGAEEEKAKKLDQAADALLERLEVRSESYIIWVTATAQNPIMAQRLASTIASDFLASQREARQEALQRVATWLKGRVDDLQSRVFATESSIKKLKAESGVTDTSLYSEQQIAEFNRQLSKVSINLIEDQARLDQARRFIASNGDSRGVPDFMASDTIRQLRQRQEALNWQAEVLGKQVGEGNASVIAIRVQLAGINKQISEEANRFVSDMQNAYDIAVRQKQALEASLQSLGNPEIKVKLQQLQSVADADRKLYDNYLSQYNEIAQRRTLQEASARIISPATLPREPSRSRRRLYALGGMSGLGGGCLLAFLLECLRPGVKTVTEIEQSFGRPVVGIIPLVQHRKLRGTDRPLRRMVDESLLQFNETVDAMRISVALSSANPKVILITSARPAEGKSTAAMLLAASSAHSGRRTILLDCDLHQPSTSQPGLSELLRGTAELKDVIIKDPATKIYEIPAGWYTLPNAADLLMSQRMRDLITELRGEFDYIVMDTPPLLPVVDALALATVADKVLVIIEWGQTPRASIAEAFKVLQPEAHRVAGIVLNKVDLNQLQRYRYHRGGYHSVGKSFNNA